MKTLILPSILSADMTQLGTEVNAVMQAGADMIHFDVMDNHYVPNLTFGPMFCQALTKKYPNIPIDVHLMVKPVDTLISAFADAGASRISIHPDSTTHLHRSLQLIQDRNIQAGLVLNPSTDTDCLKWVHQLLDFVLVMTVNPGFGGQKLIVACLDKIKNIHQNYPGLPIAIDGGVTSDNIAMLAKAGASQFVAGSAIFNSNDYKSTIAQMRRSLP